MTDRESAEQLVHQALQAIPEFTNRGMFTTYEVGSIVRHILAAQPTPEERS